MTQFPHAQCSTRESQRGFSLLELMVVVVIIGIATAAIGLNIRPDPTRALRQDARRLAQLFTIAQSEVRIDGRAIAWQADEKGYRFARAVWQLGSDIVPVATTQAGLDEFVRDDALHPRQWQSPSVRVSPATTIVLTDEWIGAPWQVRLSDGQTAVTITRDAAGRYQVN